MDAKYMKDLGLGVGTVQKFDTSDRRTQKAFFGFRKMFWDYLKKMHVPFFDECCSGASEDAATYPVRYNATLQRLEFFNGTAWADITGISETTTTTTTTTSSTTTTTTAP